jgi:hypothetical protein
VHVFSPNGENVSFTYNDHVMHELDPAQDLRNVGVAVPFGPVHPTHTSTRVCGKPLVRVGKPYHPAPARQR